MGLVHIEAHTATQKSAEEACPETHRLRATAARLSGPDHEQPLAQKPAGTLSYLPEHEGTVPPQGCYPSQAPQEDGAASTFCSNGVLRCDPSGVAWSFGTPMNNCGSGTPVYVDGGPDGSFCCATDAEDAGTADTGTEAGDAAADTGADAAPDGAPAYGGAE
jgi:hypothetical protein